MAEWAGEGNDWVQKNVAPTQDGRCECCFVKDGEVDHWAAHIFGERNKEADEWAEKRARGLTDEREDEANVVLSDVTGTCGFWDGSFRDNACGAGMWINIFTPTLV